MPITGCYDAYYDLSKGLVRLVLMPSLGVYSLSPYVVEGILTSESRHLPESLKAFPWEFTAWFLPFAYTRMTVRLYSNAKASFFDGVARGSKGAVF